MWETIYKFCGTRGNMPYASLAYREWAPLNDGAGKWWKLDGAK